VSSAIRLHLNENHFLLDSPVVQVAKQAAAEPHRYPDITYAELVESVAHWLGVETAQVVVSNGSTEIISALYRWLVDGDRSVCMPWPSYILYRELELSTGRCARRVPLTRDAIDLGELVRLVDDRTRLALICNPNNPTGSMLSRSDIRNALSDLPPGVTVVLDEAYLDFVAEPKQVSALAMVDEFPSLIVVRTFSKLHGLAGLRVGYAVTNKGRAKQLRGMLPNWNVNAVAVAAVGAVLANPTYFAGVRARVAAERDRFATALAAEGFAVAPSAANYLYVRRPDARAIATAAQEAGVHIRHGTDLGAEPDVLRVTVGLPRHNDRLLEVAAIRRRVATVP
jgi:histidinol-phosphate aminotransferase